MNTNNIATVINNETDFIKEEENNFKAYISGKDIDISIYTPRAQEMLEDARELKELMINGDTQEAIDMVQNCFIGEFLRYNKQDQSTRYLGP